MSEEGTVSVTVRLNAAVVARLDELAAAEGLTRSAIIQRLCERERDALRVVAALSFLRASFLGKLPMEPLDQGDDPVLELIVRRSSELFKSTADRKRRRSS